MNSGWISLHRKIMNSAVYSDSELLKLWIHCLLKATHADYDQLIGNTAIKLSPGQFVTGRNALANEFNKGVQPSKIVKPLSLWRRLQTLEKLEMLNIKTTNKYSVVTVLNWNDYQNNEQQLNNKRTTTEQQLNTNNNSNNSNNNNKCRKQVYDEDSIPFRLASYLYKKILENNTSHRAPNFQAWADDFRKIIELDKRDPKEIGQVIEFAQSDAFWMTNILSASKLRKQYDALNIKRNQVGKPKEGAQSPPKYKRLDVN